MLLTEVVLQLPYAVRVQRPAYVVLPWIERLRERLQHGREGAGGDLHAIDDNRWRRMTALLPLLGDAKARYKEKNTC